MKSPVPTRAEVEAGEWLVTLSQPLVAVERRRAFEAWLAADPEHAAAYERGKAVFQVSSAVSDLLAETVAEESVARESRRKRLGIAAMAASVVLVVGAAAIFAGGELLGFGAGRQFETSTAQIKDIQLEDGTRVTLGAASAVSVDLGEHERRVKLTRGEAFFEVAPDATRPFLVTVGDTVVRVVGTKFDVRYGPQAVRVAVVEGRVEVMQAAPKVSAPERRPAGKKLLVAGETALATTAGAILTSSQTSTKDFGAWRTGRLVYVDAPLRDIVSDMDRYFDGELQLADDALGEQQLTLTFRADEIALGLDLIEKALPVRVVRTDSRNIVLRGR